MTPLVAEAGGTPMAAAQGALLVSEAADPRDRYAAPTVETTARIAARRPARGRPAAPRVRRRVAPAARSPTSAPRRASPPRSTRAIGAEHRDASRTRARSRSRSPTAATAPRCSPASATLSVRPDRAARLVIDGRDGTVVAGGDMTVGEAVVSHGAVTLTIGARADAAAAPAAAGAATRRPARRATCDRAGHLGAARRRRAARGADARRRRSPRSSSRCARSARSSAEVVVR